MKDAWAQRALLQRPKAHIVHSILCKDFDLPEKESDTVAMRRQENLNSDPVTMPELYDPEAEAVKKFDITVKVQEFGKLVILSRKVQLVVEDDTAFETADNLNQCMHEMIDKVCRDTFDSAVPQITCLNGTNGNATTEMTDIDAERAIAYLDDGNTEKMTPTVEGSSRFGTGPVDASFWCIAHVHLKPDYRALDSFMPTKEYGSQESVLQAEFGAINEARVLMSTLVQKSTASPPVYNNTFIGAGAAGKVTIDKVSAEMILKPLGHNDRTNRTSSMAFTAFNACLITDDSHIVTALSTKK
jgi:N4-gp56 family major capsid protein